jgi:hypothetical protein
MGDVRDETDRTGEAADKAPQDERSRSDKRQNADRPKINRSDAARKMRAMFKS